MQRFRVPITNLPAESPYVVPPGDSEFAQLHQQLRAAVINKINALRNPSDRGERWNAVFYRQSGLAIIRFELEAFTNKQPTSRYVGGPASSLLMLEIAQVVGWLGSLYYSPSTTHGDAGGDTWTSNQAFIELTFRPLTTLLAGLQQAAA